VKSLTVQVDNLFQQWDRSDSPGCSIGIIQDGNLIYKRGYGVENLDSKIPLTATTLFDVCSIGKQFTAACIALLIQKGNISLNDDVRSYLPEMPQYETKITISHLVHHTSGLRDYIDLSRLAGNDFTTHFGQKDAIEIILNQPKLNFEPGTEHLYCNSGYILLTTIIERVSGQVFSEFAKEQIFNPLGMKDTRFYDGTESPAKGRVTGYHSDASGDVIRDRTTFFTIGDGGLLTTVDDLHLWDQNFYKDMLLGKATTNLMLTSCKLNSGEDTKYGFGLVFGDYKGLRTIHHAGEWIGYRTDMIRFPDQHFSVICLSNLGSIRSTQLTRKIADIYLVDQFDLGEFVGEYLNSELQTTFELTWEGSQIFSSRNGLDTKSLGAIRGDRFKLMGLDSRFDRDKQHNIIGFTCSTERAKNIRFMRMGPR